MSNQGLWYAAYGSNLHLEQMARRCPTAQLAAAGVITGQELLFRGRRHSAVATIEPLDGGEVPVLLWRLQPQDVQALDHYEGFPHFYRKEKVEVHLDEGKRSVMAYIMNEGHAYGAPADGYLNTILEGYRTAGFDTDLLEQAVEKSLWLARQQDQEHEDFGPGIDLRWP